MSGGEEKAMAYYRPPGEKNVMSWFAPVTRHQELPELDEPGFIFAPFKASEEFPIFYMRGKPEIIEEEDVVKMEILLPDRPKTRMSKEEYMDGVTRIQEAIETTRLKKCIAWRSEALSLKDVNPTLLFWVLMTDNPDTAAYMFYHHQKGCWIGASPETLIRLDNGNAKTMALAGTRMNSKVDHLQTWTEKEYEEHKMVSEYIEDALQEVGIPYEKTGVYTEHHFNLDHLRQDFSFEVNDPKVAAHLVRRLHPTPAVGGLPKLEALKFIEEKEKFSREYYTGYFGEVKENKDIDIFVNLRCGKLYDNRIDLFLGGGITAQSKAKAEYDETVHKSRILRNALNKVQS